MVFTPRGSLAQYCIGSPVTDEYGTLYFKNDSGNLIALTSAVRELKVAEEPEIARTEDGQWEVTGGKIVAVLANGLERDITALVEYRDDGSGGVEVVYTYGTSVQPYTKSVRTVSLNGASAGAARHRQRRRGGRHRERRYQLQGRYVRRCAGDPRHRAGQRLGRG